MARRWHAVVPNAYLAWIAISTKCMSAAGMTDAIKVTSGAWINLTYALVFVSMLLLAAQARQRTLLRTRVATSTPGRTPYEHTMPA